MKRCANLPGMVYGEELNTEEMYELEVFKRKFNRDEYDLSKFQENICNYKTFYPSAKIVSEEEKRYLKLLNNTGIISLEKLITNI